MNRPIVGIDLGTTNSAIAYIHQGKPKIIESPKQQKIIPSVILIDPNGKIIVGEDARSALVAMPDRTIAAIKRKMGQSEPIIVAEKEYLPEEISALILKELKTYVDEMFDEEEIEAIITVPAYFTDEQRKATKRAGELAGFIVERIINEPTAASLAYGLNHLNKNRHILVYDLGGGTFDVSIVEMISGLLEVKASTGNNHLGGEDFDWLLVNLFSEQIKQQYKMNPLEDLRAKALLKQEAERVKIELSKKKTSKVALPVVTMKENQPVSLYTEVSREQFEQLISDLINGTMDSVKNVLEDANLYPEDISDVILVGGSTKIPYVQQIIESYFNKKPRKGIDPDEAVALGAAVQAGLKSGELMDSGLVMTDVAPFSMGIAVLHNQGKRRGLPGAFSVIIPRNTTIPVTRKEKYYTSAPGQTKVSIEIYQGENELVKHNHLLGEFLLKGIPENYDEVEEIEVTFHYNLNGILEVSAKSTSNDAQMNITVEDGLNHDSEEALKESIEKLDWLYTNVDEEDIDDVDEDAYEYDQLDLFSDFEERSFAELKEEVETLIDQTKPYQENKKVAKLIKAAKEKIEVQDEEGLQQIIDKLTDILIDLEVE